LNGRLNAEKWGGIRYERSPTTILEKIRKNPYISYDNLIGFIGNGAFLPARNRSMIKYDEMFFVGGEDTDLLFTLIDKKVKLKATLRPSFLHKHPKRSGA
jgi:hypothetical protein